jgi:hypothetical protein
LAVNVTAAWWLVAVFAWSSQQPSAPAGTPSLDYEVFKTRIQPIFLAKRPGHTTGTPLRLQPLSPGAATWDEEQSRKNFEAVQRVAFPANPKSRLLIHPLAEEAGGDFFHNGGKHWQSQSDPEWQTLKAWILGQAK